MKQTKLQALKAERELLRTIERDKTISGMVYATAVLSCITIYLYFTTSDYYFEQCMSLQLQPTTHECIKWADYKTSEAFVAALLLASTEGDYHD